MGLDIWIKRKVAYYPQKKTNDYNELNINGFGIKVKSQPSMLSRIVIEELVLSYFNSWYIAEWFSSKGYDDCYNCSEDEISFDTLLELKETCIQVLNQNELAEKLLPSFEKNSNGLMKFDEHYFHILQETVEKINEMEIAEKERKDEFIYSYAAWW